MLRLVSSIRLFPCLFFFFFHLLKQRFVLSLVLSFDLNIKPGRVGLNQGCSVYEGTGEEMLTNDSLNHH